MTSMDSFDSIIIGLTKDIRRSLSSISLSKVNNNRKILLYYNINNHNKAPNKNNKNI